MLPSASTRQSVAQPYCEAAASEAALLGAMCQPCGRFNGSTWVPVVVPEGSISSRVA